MSLIHDYLLEYDADDLKKLQMLYGRTKGSKRKELKKKINLIKKNLKKAQRKQKKVAKNITLAKHGVSEKGRKKALKKGEIAHAQSQAHLKKAEKLMKKTGTTPGNIKVPKKPQFSRAVGAARWKRLGKGGLVAAGVIGGAHAGQALYKRIKNRRHEGMSLTINELRDEILYEVIQENDLEIVDERIGRALSYFAKRAFQKGGQVATKGTGVKGGPGKFKRYVKHMGPLGTAFDIMFVFELGHMAYKRFFTKAAKACKGVPDRSMCIRRYKIGAKGAQIKVLQSKIGMCSKDKKPDKCKFRVKRKIDNLKDDIKMLRQEL